MEYAQATVPSKPDVYGDAMPREAPLDPDREICDPHHHLWDLPPGVRNDAFGPYDTFLLPQLLAAFDGHRVTSTIAVEAGAFYRADAAPHLASVGETEAANGVAAMSASGRYGPARICAGIIANVDLRLGDRVAEAIDAHLRTAGGRLRGVRQSAAFDPTGAVPDFGAGIRAGLYGDADFRAGLARLGTYGLVFDAWIYHPQIGDVVALARALPDQPIVVDHLGTPLGVGGYAADRQAVFASWRAGMHDLATCPNVAIKIGGLGMAMSGFGPEKRDSQTLADLWRPYVETCIELFGAGRCMFESNYPVDGYSARYGTIWNAFKRIAAPASEADKAGLFKETARRIYGLDRSRPV